MGILWNRGSAARSHAGLWTLVIAAGTVAFAGCRLPHANAPIAPPPVSSAAAAESTPSAAVQARIEAVLHGMKAAYDGVTDYRSEVEVTFFAKDGFSKSDKVLFTFKKPNRTRLEFVSPHPGMILVYPDADGKVAMRPNGLLSLFTFHLMLDDPLLETPSGQRFNQTDLGLLIANIGKSVGAWRRGPVSLSEDEGSIRIRVLAADHFREGVETRYEFLIGKKLWLPVEVDAFTPDGVREGRITFRDLRTNVGVPDSLFQ
jgi:outer membrane lipoprotein-sorting protein